jgi:hypothetical protein
MMPKQDQNLPEDTLQQRLEQLEAGVPLDVCLKDLSQQDRELLKMAATLREAPSPARDPSIVSAQRAQVVRLMGQQHRPKSQTSRAEEETGLASLWNWLRPRRAYVGVAGAVMVLFTCALVAFLALWLLRGMSPEVEVADSPAEEQAIAEASPVASEKERVTQFPSPEPTGDESGIESPLQVPTPEPAYTAYMPVVSGQGARDPEHATLQEIRGLVQVQRNDGAWGPVREKKTVAAGWGVRTGALSSAVLTFYDGSVARLGPNSEVWLDELDARQADGPRLVALTQRMGETEHDVAASTAAGSSYQVRTASSLGEAKGTRFRVQVPQDDLARFNVDRGVVAVTGQDVTVDVVAGQSTTVVAGEPPDAPTFRITGEGEVTQTGATWIIAGQPFETHAGTHFVGDPQIGDWVLVEGRLMGEDVRVADRIVLLRDASANRFTITGSVETMGRAEWAVAGQTIMVDENTSTEGDVQIDSLVRVEGVILKDGVLLAERIRLLDDAPGLPFGFTGIVQGIADETWIISGIIINVDDATTVDAGIAIGDIVNVRGWILQDGRWLARTIRHVSDPERSFAFTGEVENIAPWVVGGVPFQIRDWTEIEPGIQIGDLVSVEGRILEDGTWVASEIVLVDEDEDEDLLRVVFVGEVDDIDPWTVSGIPLTVNEATAIQGDIAVGDRVKVTVTILPDGTWLATRIELVDKKDGGLGCVTITAVVVGTGSGWVEVPNRPRINLEGVTVEGDLQVGSVIVMVVCVDEDGSITIERIIVIYNPEPIKPPPPPSPPETDQDHKVTVCHKPNGKNPHSITIARSALEAHLNHGDTLGPCK